MMDTTAQTVISVNEWRRGFVTNDGSKKTKDIEIQQQLDIYCKDKLCRKSVHFELDVEHILDMVAMQWICIFSVTNDGNNMVISQLDYLRFVVNMSHSGLNSTRMIICMVKCIHNEQYEEAWLL
eukprot:730874_1